MRLTKTGDEANFLQAIEQPKIKVLSDEQIGPVIKLIMLKVGVRSQNLPSAIEKDLLISHIRSNYGGHTLQEVNLAFDMAISGKLECDPRCFENFSCLYFSSIMNAYRAWAKNAYRENERPVMLIEEKVELSEKEKEEWMAGYKEVDIDFIPLIFFDWLQVDNEPFLPEAVKHVKRGILTSNESELIKSRNIAEFERQEVSGFVDEYKSMIINASKRMAVKQYLKTK